MKNVVLTLTLLCFVSMPIFAQTGGRAKPNSGKKPTVTSKQVGPTTSYPSYIPPPPPMVQKTKEEDDVIKVDTDLVTTPISVMDRNGRFIAGLKKKDFKIYENFAKQ